MPHVAKTCRNGPRQIAPTAHFERNDATILCETAPQGFLTYAMYIVARDKETRYTPSRFCCYDPLGNPDHLDNAAFQAARRRLRRLAAVTVFTLWPFWPHNFVATHWKVPS